jgi:hypothetical protein
MIEFEDGWADNAERAVGDVLRKFFGLPSLEEVHQYCKELQEGSRLLEEALKGEPDVLP